MKLSTVFGWHLDGLAYPECVGGARSALGSLVTGPAGLVGQFATRLGLEKAPVSHAVRIAKYMSAVAACDDGCKFYSRSFEVDPWSTSVSLLAMRDQLIAAGWSGTTINDSSLRLSNLAAVEACCAIESPAELFRNVLFSLRNRTSKLPFGSITLATPARLLPKAWQEILSILAASGAAIEEAPGPSPTQDSYDLAKIQRFLHGRQVDALSGDGSICLLEADDEYQLSEAVALWLLKSEAVWQDLAIIRANPTPVLDAYLGRYGLPKLGKYAKSRWRTHLQLLPLAFENRWLPAHPLRLLEFLSLPLSPVRQGVARHFKWALHKEPGFGGALWSSAWTTARSELNDWLSASGAVASHGDTGDTGDPVDAGNAADTSEKQLESILRQLRFWLEPERYQPEEGIPASEAMEVCRRLSKWAASRQRSAADDKAHIAHLTHFMDIVDDTRQAIIATGLSRIKKIQLDRIMDAAIGEGVPLESRYAEAADWSLVDEPGQIWSNVGTLLWWGFTSRAAATSVFSPWTRSERLALADANIHVEAPERAIVRDAHAWRRAILYARNAVLLARPRVLSGSVTALHPLWDELHEFVASQKSAVVRQAHEIFARPKSTLGQSQLELQPVERASLPTARRYWPVPENKIAARAEESFSSMHQLLGCPMSWVLEYKMQLHPTTLLAVPDGDQLVGEIAHAVFRELFQAGINLPNKIADATGQLFDRYVQTIGLPLQLPGRKFDMETARRLICLAAVEFARLLGETGLLVEACEASREAPFGEGKFKGQIDVLLRDKDKGAFIIDYKWATKLRYRLEELQSGRQLQLAAYAWLQSHQDGVYPQAGYFMLRQRRLLVTDGQPFESAQYVHSQPLDGIWRAAERAYQETFQSLRRGEICATGVTAPIESDQPAEPEQQPLVEPPCKFCDFGVICGAKELSSD